MNFLAKPFSVSCVSAFCLVRLLIGLSARPVVAQEMGTTTLSVTATFDGKPFAYQVVASEPRSGHRLMRLRFPSSVVSAFPQNNTVPAVLFMPDDIKPSDPKRPAVICLPILNGDEDLTSTVCAVLVKRGIPALMFTLPYYKERGPREGRHVFEKNIHTFVEGLEQTMADIRRATDLLALRPEVDPRRLGISGISLGGILAATAGGLDARLQRVGLLLAGGDLQAMIHHAQETHELSTLLQNLPPAERADVDARLLALDPLTLAPALRERSRQGRVLMINAAQDEVVPPDCTRKLAAALDMTNRVVWLEGLGHYTAMAELPRALRLIGDFFAQDLPPGVAPVASNGTATNTTPLLQVIGVAQQAITMLTVEPAARRCHFLEAELTATNKDGQPVIGQARLVVGAEGRFSLRCKMPSLGEVTAGQGSYPWLCGGSNQTVFAGTLDPTTNQTAWSHLAPEHLSRYRMFAGVAATLLLVPDLAQKWVKAEKDDAAPNGHVLRVTARDAVKTPGFIRLTMSDDDRAPTSADFDVSGMKGHLRIRGWQTNTVATDALFEPPRSASRQEVSQADVHRMFSAVLNFAGEMLDDKAGKPTNTALTLSVAARDPAGHGLLCRQSGKSILMVKGTPAQMGAAHGALLGEPTRRMVERVVYGVGAADTFRSGDWFPKVLDSIEHRIQPHLPPRFFEECDALADATGLPRRDVRYANLFPDVIIIGHLCLHIGRHNIVQVTQTPQADIHDGHISA